MYNSDSLASLFACVGAMCGTIGCAVTAFSCEECVQLGMVCNTEENGCLPACELDADCEQPDVCSKVDGETACCTPCDSTQCALGSECDSACGQCRPVECGTRVSCTSPSDFCDFGEWRCLPENGSCSELPCPTFAVDSLAAVQVGCDGAVCRATNKPPELSFIDSEASASLTTPAPGQEYLLGDDPVFEWSPIAGAIFVLVLNRIPATRQEFLASVVWASALPEGAASRVAWSNGHVVVNGEWGAHPTEAPAGGSYYAFLEVVREDVLIAKSPVVLFVVGEVITYPQPGIHCAGERFAGACHNPGRPLACVNSVCRLVCASHEDCATSRCEPPQDGVRLCAL